MTFRSTAASLPAPHKQRGTLRRPLARVEAQAVEAPSQRAAMASSAQSSFASGRAQDRSDVRSDVGLREGQPAFEQCGQGEAFTLPHLEAFADRDLNGEADLLGKLDLPEQFCKESLRELAVRRYK
jgi:hypothetical protein